jgi:hypothetical protein
MSSKSLETAYTTIIIEPDLDSRMRLKTAMSSVYQFGRSHQVVSLNDGLAKLSSEFIDVVFISYRFSKEEVLLFIDKAKSTKGGIDTAYVAILPAKEQLSSVVAQSIMKGYDGMLFEPYSVDQLLEITQLASRVKLERSAAREKTAIVMMIQDLIIQLDQVSYVKSCKVDSGVGFKKFREMCTLIKGLDQAKLDVYFENVVNAFEEAQPPKPVPQNMRYGGVSSRIKKKLEQKIISELDPKDA